MIARESLARFESLGVVAAAKALRRSTRTINKLAQQLGVEFHATGGRPTDRELSKMKKRQDGVAKQIREMARKRMSQSKICAALGITRAVLRRIATEHHIDINSRSLG